MGFLQGEDARKISIKTSEILKETGLLEERWLKMMHWIFQIFCMKLQQHKGWKSYKIFVAKLFIWGFSGKNPLKGTCSEEMEACHSAISRELLELVYWFGCPKSEAKKLSSTLPKRFFFIKHIINSCLLCEIYHKLDILDAYLWVEYSMAEEKSSGFLNNQATAT